MEIETAQTEEPTIRVKIALITGFVATRHSAIGAFPLGEYGLRQIGPAIVARRHRVSRKVYLSHFPAKQLLTGFRIANKGTHAIAQIAHGQRIHLTCQVLVYHNIGDRLSLGGAVGVENPRLGKTFDDLQGRSVAKHLSAENDVVEPGQEILVERRINQAHLDKGRRRNPCCKVTCSQSAERGPHGLLVFGLQGEQGIARGQTGDNVEQAHIEGVGHAVEADAVGPLGEKCAEIVHKGVHAARGHLNTFGAAGAPRGEQQIEGRLIGNPAGTVPGASRQGRLANNGISDD